MPTLPDSALPATAGPMPRHLPDRFAWRWLAFALVLCVAGVLAIVQVALGRLERDFETDARIVHRLLSQGAAQHDAVLAMLALLQPAGGDDGAVRRLPAIYPQILRVAWRAPGGEWPADVAAAGLDAAQARSRREGHAVPTGPAFAEGRVWLVLAAEPTSYALQLDLRAMIPAAEWPVTVGAQTSATLVHEGRRLVLRERAPGDGLRRFVFDKPLAAQSQPFSIELERSAGWRDLPWVPMILWIVAACAGVAAAHAYLRQRRARRRAEELVRLGQTGRLNTMGELSAGLAHELNQPLTAILASTQAARRLLAEEPVQLGTVREAMDQAVRQARRATEVLTRLRRLVERPGTGAAIRQVDLRGAVDDAIELLRPEFSARGVQLRLEGERRPVVLADPVGLEQIIHNLVMNALHALERMPPRERTVTLAVEEAGPAAVLRVSDTGPGLSPEAMRRAFEPFYSTREGGLGLGLSLSESLAAVMGGTLVAANGARTGAVFTVSLPRAG